jgi:hypothetical protein
VVAEIGMKTNGLLAILVLSLALFAYVERQGQPYASQVAEQGVKGEPLFPVRPENVAGIRIKDSHGCMSIGTEGQLRETAEKLLVILSQAQIVRRLALPLPDASIYGLEQPRTQIEILLQDNRIIQSVSVGSTNPSGSAVYVQEKGQPEVMLVGSYFLTALDMPLQKVRNKNDNNMVGEQPCPANETGS